MPHLLLQALSLAAEAGAQVQTASSHTHIARADARFSVSTQVLAGAEAHGGVQPGGHGQLGGLGSHAEPRDDQGQHRGRRGAGGAQRVVWCK